MIFDNLVNANGEPIVIETSITDEEVEHIKIIARESAERFKKTLATWKT